MDTGGTEPATENRTQSPAPPVEPYGEQAETPTNAGPTRPRTPQEPKPADHRTAPATTTNEEVRTSDARPPAPDAGEPAGAPGAPPHPATPTRTRRIVRAWRNPRLRWPKRIALTLLLVLLLPSLAAGIALRVNYAGDPAPGTRARNRDALWLGHAWVDGRKGDAEVEALAERLRSTGIRDLYVHAGPLEHDGTLPAAAYPGAGRLIAAVHRQLSDVRVQAWLGDELASEGPVGLRLERAVTRDAVVRSARQVLAAGFDGVHFDLEPLHSGDRDYLSLLDDLHRVTRARGVPLSVAAHQIDPLPAVHSLGVALYVDFAATEADWTAYRQGWVQ